jgi:LPS-assembly lipoprotein
LAGCGFRPLYGAVETESGAVEPGVVAELAAVRVGHIGERFGQLLRRDLQRRLEGSAPGTPLRYDLSVAVSFAAEVLGYRRDGSVSRVRYTTSGTWTLLSRDATPQVIARSPLPYRTIDSFNVPDLQFFSADTSREAMERRIVESVGEEIVREVAIALRSYLADGRGSGPSAS